MQVAFLMLVVLVGVQCDLLLPFIGLPVDPENPHYKGLFRRALATLSLKAEGTKVLKMSEKFEVYRAAYRVSYIDEKGQTCFLEFRVNLLFGDLYGSMPTCQYGDHGSPGILTIS